MGHVGDVVTMLTSFKRGLDQWRTEGPPPPKSIHYTDFLSQDELRAAHAHRRAELTNPPGIADWDDAIEECTMSESSYIAEGLLDA